MKKLLFIWCFFTSLSANAGNDLPVQASSHVQEATSNGNLSGGESVAFQKFKSGDLRMSDSGCGGIWGWNLQEMKVVHDSGQWDRLALKVIELDCTQNLSYYFLGRSAEGMALPSSAKIYYQLAKESWRKCDDLFNNCKDFIFPKDIDDRLANLGTGNDPATKVNPVNQVLVNLAESLKPFKEVPSVFPPDFKGNDLKGLITFLKENGEALGIVKDEFTSSATFLPKAAKAVVQLNQNGQYIFVKRGLYPKYNADSEKFEIKLYYESFRNDLKGLMFTSERTALGSYEASNAYGKSVTVIKFKETSYSLGFDNLNSNNNSNEMAMTLPMKPEEARQVKDDLAVVIVCKIASPPTLEEDSHREPIIDSPLDIETHHSVLRVRITGLRIINLKTGLVYQSL